MVCLCRWVRTTRRALQKRARDALEGKHATARAKARQRMDRAEEVLRLKHDVLVDGWEQRVRRFERQVRAEKLKVPPPQHHDPQQAIAHHYSVTTPHRPAAIRRC